MMGILVFSLLLRAAVVELSMNIVACYFEAQDTTIRREVLGWPFSYFPALTYWNYSMDFVTEYHQFLPVLSLKVAVIIDNMIAIQSTPILTFLFELCSNLGHVHTIMFKALTQKGLHPPKQFQIFVKVHCCIQWDPSDRLLITGAAWLYDSIFKRFIFHMRAVGSMYSIFTWGCSLL